MATDIPLKGRRWECEQLDGLVTAVWAGLSRALVLRGEPSVGKTALLDYVAQRASGCRVTRAAGVQSEMELVYAGLHQLCARCSIASIASIACRALSETACERHLG